MTARPPTTARTDPALAAVPMPERDPLYTATAIGWILDESIPWEVRTLCQLLYARAIADADQRSRQHQTYVAFDTLGRGSIDVNVDYAWVAKKTGYTETRIRTIFKAAQKLGIIERRGAPRSGYSYVITATLRTHRPTENAGSTWSLTSTARAGRSTRAIASPLGLDPQFDPLPAEAPRHWRRPERAFYGGAPARLRGLLVAFSPKQRARFVGFSAHQQHAFLDEVAVDRERYIAPTDAKRLEFARVERALEDFWVRTTDAKPTEPASPAPEYADVWVRPTDAITPAATSEEPANTTLCVRTTDAKGDLASVPQTLESALRPNAGPKSGFYVRTADPKNRAYNDRARVTESIQRPAQHSVAEVLEPVHQALLLLAQKRKGEETTTLQSPTFIEATRRIVATLLDFTDGSVQRAHQALEQLITDPRVTAHENPIGFLITGVCRRPPFLLTVRPQGRMTRAQRALEGIPWPLRETLLERVRADRVDERWCHERDIPTLAFAEAQRIVKAERFAAPPPAEVAATSAEPEGGVDEVLTPDWPSWFIDVAEHMRGRLSTAAYEGYFRALRAEDTDGVRTICIPTPFGQRMLERALGQPLASEFARAGFTGRIIIEDPRIFDHVPPAP